MKLTMKSARDLAAMLEQGLAGRPKALRVNNQDAVVIEPFSFAGDAPVILAVNLNRLKPHLDEHEAANKAALLAAMKGTGKVEPGTPEMEALSRQQDDLLAQTIEVDLRKVALADLKPTDNRFSPGEIFRLLPILTYDLPAEAKAA